MSNLDVRALAQEDLPEDSFPVTPQADFRLHLAPAVHQGISQHAKSDTSVEICGVLVGQWRQDEQGPYAVVDDYIRCDSATSKFAEVTFTHESWALINREMDTRFEDKRIVGWYHSHPDFGIFLSDRDCFIHEHFFSGAGQIAYVVDPVRDLEGAFAWKNGKPTLMPHYWIGPTICAVQASISNPAADEKRSLSGDAATHDTAVSPREAGQPAELPLATTLLSFLALFLLGYLLAGFRTSWERQAVVDGVVSRYTDFKLVRIGLRSELAEIQKQLSTAAKQLKEMPATTEILNAEQQEDLAKVRKRIVGSLLATERRLLEMSNRYGYSDEECQALIMHVKAQREAQRRKLRQGKEAKKAPSVKKNDDATSEPAAKRTDATTPAASDDESPSPRTDLLEDKPKTTRSHDTAER